MSYLGDFPTSALVVFNFNTASFTDGSPITLGGTPALSVYKNSTTESTAGITLSVDYDSRTGMHHVAIDTSADGTFYASGNDFSVVITTGTVGGTSVVGRVVGEFSINNRGGNVTRWNGTAVASPATAGIPDVNVKNINNVAATSVTTINANLGTTQPVNFTGTGASALAKSDMVDIAGAAVSTSSAQIGANVVNVKGSASAGAAGYVGIDWSAINAPTTAVNLSGTTIATVTNQLTAAAIATGVWQDATAGDFTVASSIGKSLYTGNHAPGAASGLSLVGSSMDVSSINSVATSSVTTVNANIGTTQPANFTGTGASALIKSDAVDVAGSAAATSLVTIVWDSLISGHTTTGTFGGSLNAAGSAGDPWATSLPGAYTAGTAGYIVGNNLDTQVSTRAPSATALSTAQWTNTLATNLGTLASHDPGATLGTSTLTQAQVTGGAYALNSASFAFNAALDFTTAQKAATLARVTLVDTTTTNTDMRGTDNAALAATALSTAQWTNALATNLGTLAGHDPGSTLAAASDVPTASQNAAAVIASTITELSAIPAASPTLSQAIAMLFMALRNQLDITDANKTLYKDDGTALGSKALSDDGTTYTEAKLA